MKVQNTRDASAHALKIIVAGEAGNGKTTLAKTLQEGLGEKVIVVSAEAGLLSIRDADVDFIDLQADDQGEPIPKESRIARLGQVYQWLLEPAQTARYKWIFLDSLTELNQNLFEMLESLKGPDGESLYAGAKNNIKKYGELASRMRSLCKTFRDIQHYSVVFSALTKEDTNSDGIKTLKVNLTGKFADDLPALFDEIVYLGVTSDVGDDGRNVRAILTQKTDKILFPKDRSGALSKLEPADLSVIVKKIRGAVKPALVPDISKAAKAAHQESVKQEEKKAAEA